MNKSLLKLAEQFEKSLEGEELEDKLEDKDDFVDPTEGNIPPATSPPSSSSSSGIPTSEFWSRLKADLAKQTTGVSQFQKTCSSVDVFDKIAAMEFEEEIEPELAEIPERPSFDTKEPTESGLREVGAQMYKLYGDIGSENLIERYKEEHSLDFFPMNEALELMVGYMAAQEKGATGEEGLSQLEASSVYNLFDKFANLLDDERFGEGMSQLDRIKNIFLDHENKVGFRSPNELLKALFNASKPNDEYRVDFEAEVPKDEQMSLIDQIGDILSDYEREYQLEDDEVAPVIFELLEPHYAMKEFGEESFEDEPEDLPQLEAFKKSFMIKFAAELEEQLPADVEDKVKSKLQEMILAALSGVRLNDLIEEALHGGEKIPEAAYPLAQDTEADISSPETATIASVANRYMKKLAEEGFDPLASEEATASGGTMSPKLPNPDPTDMMAQEETVTPSNEPAIDPNPTSPGINPQSLLDNIDIFSGAVGEPDLDASFEE